MGGDSSVTPLSSFGPLPRGTRSVACNDSGILLITDSDIVEIRQFDGRGFNKQLSLSPTCCCATVSRHWIIGFASGFLSEFDPDLNLLFSFREPGGPRAHPVSITKIFPVDDSYGGSAHVISFGSDGNLHFWSRDGLLLSRFSPKNPLVHISAATRFAFLADDSNQILAINLETFDVSAYAVQSKVKVIVAVDEGLAALAVFEDHSICIVSASQIVVSFRFGQADTVLSVLPLNVEAPIGLVTYAAIDMQKKVTLRALEKSLLEIADGVTLLAEAKLSVVVQKGTTMFAVSRDELAALSMNSLPDMELPRARIAAVLTRG
jgi:hypothetical protein